MTLRELIIQTTGITPKQTVLDLDRPILGYKIVVINTNNDDELLREATTSKVNREQKTIELEVF